MPKMQRFNDLEQMEELIKILKSISIVDIFEFEENYDEQFMAIKHMYFYMKDPKKFVSLVVVNALVCYQLNCTGEEYWWEFSHYFAGRDLSTRNVSELFIGFISKSRCNRRLRNIKIRRIRKIWPLIVRHINDIEWLVENQWQFAKIISDGLRTKLSSKTIVFMVKMLNYALRIVTNKRIVAPFEADIPLDSRIERISESLGIKNPLLFWREVSRIVGIPCLHIDSLLWISLRLIGEEHCHIDSKIGRLVAYISKIL